MMKKILAVALAALLTASGLQARTASVKGVDLVAFEKDMAALLDSLHAVGASLAVVKDNKIVYTHSFGVKNLETKEPMTDETMFRIASISKSFSATSMMQLIAAGKVTLDTDVSDIAGFKIRNPKFPDTPITLKMLLTHTSSINDSEGYYITTDVINPAKNPNWAKCYNNYEPGKGYEYCNLNFSLVGTFIEKLTGVRFDKYIQANILDPLGIENGFFVNEIEPSRLATLYEWNGKKFTAQPGAYKPIPDDILQNYVMGSYAVKFSPAGGMKVTATNLAKYMLMHMNYGKSPLSKKRVIREDLSKAMQRVYFMGEDKTGFALMNTDVYSKPQVLVGHTGGAYGLRSGMFFNPAEKYGFVFICNGNGARYGEILRKPINLMYRYFVVNAGK